ncbi:MAG: PHP domain-containing protein [Candidatus Hodarchaeota archaeon]
MANLSKYNRGSEWRKWDLHFHTPSSYDYENDSITNQDIIDCLLSSEIDVVAITDHHYIDVNRINELRKLSEERLIILPGIELRSELGDKPIHYIGIFSERVNLEHLWDTIKGTFRLTPDGINKMGGDDRVYIPISKAFDIFQELGGLISIHAGAKSNSIEGIENREQFQQRIKYDITKDFVGILEIGQLKDINRYMSIVFPATGLERPLIIGSDNHNITDYKTSLPCWLKADPTFIGLRQVLNEPVERVHIGDRPRVFGQI